MFKNYLRSAWRNLVKSKLYSFINIGGLSVGISICMLIMIYVAHEMSFDRFHKNAGRIFTINMSLNLDGKAFSFDRMSYESGPMIKASDPGIETYLRVKGADDNKIIENVVLPERKFKEGKILFADSNFFQFFSFPLVHGDPAHVLNRPFTMVISRRAARKYFGDDDPVGKLLKYEDHYNFEITGVVRDPPSNSSIDYDFISSVSSLFSMKEENPGLSSGRVESGGFQTYLGLKANADAASTGRLIQQLSGAPSSKFKYSVYPFVNKHTGSGDSANARYMKMFSLVAALILLMALINYMSLATARSSTRSKEIGVRKVLGADREKIVKQFYVESTLYALIAYLFGFLLFNLLKPFFYNMLQLQIDSSFMYSPLALGFFTGLLVLTILIAGSYPSLVLSSFNPIRVLYGRNGKEKAGASTRKFFTVLQFAISIVLIIASIIIHRQLYFFRHMDTGVDKEHVIMIPFPREISPHYLAFKKSVENIRGVNGVALAQNPMYGGQDISLARPREASANIAVPVMTVDNAFIELLGLEWKFPPGDKVLGQPGQVVINEEAIAKLNLPANPVGQVITIDDTVQVCGVLKNFNFGSLHHRIDALCLFVRKDTDSAWRSDFGDCLFARIDPHVNIASLLVSVKKVYDGFDDKTPFEYQFMDEAFNSQFKAENKLAKVFSVLTILTIIIACLGLFGLAAFSATQRTKEIGVRKVLGADMLSIVFMISRNFIGLVMVSILIAMPVAWFFMNKWLENFAYRIGIPWWVFVLAGISALAIAMITISFQAVKVAIANPVKSLRTE